MDATQTPPPAPFSPETDSKVVPFPTPARQVFASARLLNELYLGKAPNLDKVEKALGAKLVTRDDWLEAHGPAASQAASRGFFEILQLAHTASRKGLTQSDFDNILRVVAGGGLDSLREAFEKPAVIRVGPKSVAPKTLNQKLYLQAIRKFELVFGIGPAGTGKTYLAVAAALEAIVKGEVDRLVLTRPAVEAGEALGFLPGDLQQKIQPYLQPLYDAMSDILGREASAALMEKNKIEVAPLAYMRGRTLSNAFVILDEAQNTTPEQMMMFLTRLGDRGRMVVTGDITQVDLPRHKRSGLKVAMEVLQRVEGISFFQFHEGDVVRHPLVQKIILAYQKYQDGREWNPGPGR